MTFGNEFTNAVEQKQIAQQEAERAKFVVEKVWYLNYIIDIHTVNLTSLALV